MNIQKLTVCALFAAFLCVMSPFSLPFGAIPISLATFCVFIVACTVRIGISLPALLIYILLGTFGLPVFAGFTGGFQQLAGITGGYIAGYIPCLIIISLLTEKHKNNKYIYPISMLIGICLCYTCGTVWYIFQTKSSIYTALSLCVLPFVFGDIIKIVAASIIGFTLRTKINNINKFI